MRVQNIEYIKHGWIKYHKVKGIEYKQVWQYSDDIRTLFRIE